jgi:dimethylargininase
MLAQHAAYVAALAAAGLTVEMLDPLPGSPDAYFVEDTAVVTAELAVVTLPGAPARRGEVESIAVALARHRPVLALEPPATLDGGDVLQVGRRVFVGLSARTNEAGAEQLGALLAAHEYATTAVPVGAGLHLKSSVNALDEETLLLTAALADLPVFRDYERLIVAPGEEYAANVLAVNDVLLVPRGYPETRRRLAQLGRPIVELDVSGARAMDGGLTCMSLRF